MQMEQNSKLVDTSPTFKGQNQALNVESTLSSQTKKVMKNLEVVRMMSDLETDPTIIPLIRRCMIMLERISDLEMDLQCLSRRERAIIVRDRIIGQTVSGSATCSHHDCRIGKQSNINYSDPVMRNLEAVLETILLMKDVQSNPLIKRCMIVLKRVSDLEMDLQCLPIKKRATIVRVRIIGQVTGSATCSHQESCNDDTDLREDGNWAIEKQNIARPPIGWERVLKIRGSRRTRFADVYYFTPSGKRLRSTVDVQRYLDEHPDEAERVALSQFSFRPPRPLLK